MVNARRGLLATTLWLAIALYPGGAFATYVFTTVDVPGATFTSLWGINNVGLAAAEAFVPGNNDSGFVYVSGQWVPLPVPPAGLSVGGLGINDALVVVGGAVPLAPPNSPEQGFILDLQTATYTKFFSHPGWPNTEARSISNTGVITGYAYDSSGNSIGFIYNPATEQFTDIVPPPGSPTGNLGFNVAQGSNTAGYVVGSYFNGHHSIAFLRDPATGDITLLFGNNPSTARGINDNGLITGRMVTSGNSNALYVGNPLLGYQVLTCPVAVCPDLFVMLSEGINNLGQIAGSWFDAGGTTHGFIATPASLPTGTTAAGAYTFDVSVVPNVMIFIDPTVSLGFDYAIGTDDPKFASVQLPIGIGDSLYTLIVHGQAFALAGGDTFDFAAHGFAKGVAQFRVADIEASAGLDPNNAAAFPTGLTFTAAGTFTGTMTPLCRSTPLPHQANAPVGRGLSPCLSQ